MNDLLALGLTLEEPADLVSRCGRVLARSDHRSQDSGNVSWLVGTDDGDLFVKSAGTAGGPPPGAPRPVLGHGGRVELLRNGVDLAAA